MYQVKVHYIICKGITALHVGRILLNIGKTSFYEGQSSLYAGRTL